MNSFDAHMQGVPSDLITDLRRLGVEGGDVVDFIPPGTIKLGLWWLAWHIYRKRRSP